ncbi:MAG: hypothetical protein J6S85_10370 [Methanobrevibacter sp.]|nr:hypothetical protein [Methanobrevibacter sp.]
MADLERITDDPDMTIYDTDIDMCIDLFCQKYHIEDMTKAPQNQWNACLMFICSKLFKNTGVLKDKTPLEGYINTDYTTKYNNTNISNSNCNRYNIELLTAICDYYIYLCSVYDKEVSIMGYSRLTGINPDTIHDWGNEINKLSRSGCDIYRKLNRGREESLVSKLTSNKNPVAVIAILNKHFGYNMPGVKQAENHNRIGTIDDIKQLMIEKNDNSDVTG